MKTKKTHCEMSQDKKKSGRECTAHDVAPGGRCLNCGFETYDTSASAKPTHSTGHYYDYRDGENIALYDGNKIVGILYGLNSAAVTRAHLWEAAPSLLALVKQYRQEAISQGADVSDVQEIDKVLRMAGEDI